MQGRFSYSVWTDTHNLWEEEENTVGQKTKQSIYKTIVRSKPGAFE